MPLQKIERSFEYYWLESKNDSIIVNMIANDVLSLIKKTSIFENGDICAVVVNGEERTLKNVIQNSNTSVVTATNPIIYPPIIFVCEQCNNIFIAGNLLK